jgi:hypothetical protein
MSLSLAQLREELRRYTGKNATQLPNADADLLLNFSWWALSSQLRFNERETEASFTCVAGTESYAIPADHSAIQRVVIQGIDETDWHALVKIDDWNMFELKDDTETERPTHYSRRDALFILWPNPDAAYDVRVKYLRSLADIEASGPDAPREWHEVILWGAIARGFFSDGDWARGKEAQAQQIMYLNSLDTEETKDREDRPMSGVRILKRRYP